MREIAAITTISIGAICLIWYGRRRCEARRVVDDADDDVVADSEPTMKCISRATSPSEAACLIRAQGVCIIEIILSNADITKLQTRIMEIKPIKMHNRRTKRWEYVYSPTTPPLAELATHPTIIALVRSLLGPNTYLEKAGLIISHPGAPAQNWHMDTPHLFSCGTHLPPHSISLLLPLCDLHVTNGPTEFKMGTHIKVNVPNVPHLHDVAICPKGSVIAYDTRVLHRGGPNQTMNDDRTLVYLTFSRIWYRDTLNP